VDKFLFINTAYTLKGKFSERIKNVCNIQDNDYWNVEVSEDDMTDMAQKIEAKLQANQLPQDARFLVHITGGTKPMSLGVFSFFEKKKNTEFYYITFPKTTQYQRLHTDRSPEYYSFKYKITLEDYLLAYGINIDSKQNELVKDTAYTEQLTLSSRDDTKAERDKHLELLEEQDDVDEDELNYYKYHGYFEEYIYSVVKAQLNLNDDQIGLSVKTKQPLVDDPEIADHEIDIMFIYENHLYIIECKTGAKPKLFENTVFRLYSIKQRIGFSNGYIFMLQPLKDEDGNLPEVYAKKAKPSGITVLDGTDIKQQTGLLPSKK